VARCTSLSSRTLAPGSALIGPRYWVQLEVECSTRFSGRGGNWVDKQHGGRHKPTPADGNHHLAKVRVDYVLGAKWLLRVRLLPHRTWTLHRLPGNKHRSFRVGDVPLLAEEP